MRKIITPWHWILLAGPLCLPSCLTAMMWGVRPGCGPADVTRVTVERRATAAGRHPRFLANGDERKTRLAIDVTLEEDEAEEWGRPIPRSGLLILEPLSSLDELREIAGDPRRVESLSLDWFHHRDDFDGAYARARLVTTHQEWEGEVRARWSPQEDLAEETDEETPDVRIDLQETAIETSSFQAVWRAALTPATVVVDFVTLPILLPLVIASI